MKWTTEDGGWSPYLAGGLVGLLAILSVYATTEWMGKSKYLGASTTFVHAAGILEQTTAPEHVEANAYFARTKVQIDWQFMLVLGIFLGALISSVTDRSYKLEGDHYEQRSVVGSYHRRTFWISAAERSCSAF